ncbi:AraC family transcriptional regulator [Actinoplanes sp. NPDC051343]|uniref:AraC family transcriptional regulator n=1 Tax=Actinoplanes sp. NPDC051343 TaxID=3363906 RepID=UPI0037B59328
MRWAVGMQCLQLRLSPLVAKAILGFGLRELVSADDLWDRELAVLGERLSEQPGWEARFGLADAWLGDKWLNQRRKALDLEVGRAWRQICRSGGRVRVEEVADEVGWSRKRLWARFHDQVGLPPKRAARLVRFDRPCTGWRRGTGGSRTPGGRAPPTGTDPVRLLRPANIAPARSTRE